MEVMEYMFQTLMKTIVQTYFQQQQLLHHQQLWQQHQLQQQRQVIVLVMKEKVDQMQVW